MLADRNQCLWVLRVADYLDISVREATYLLRKHITFETYCVMMAGSTNR